MKLLFAREPSQGLRLLCLIALSVMLMILDHRYHRLEKLRDTLSYVVYPIQLAVDTPMRGLISLQHYLYGYQKLIKENSELKKQQLIQNARLQTLMALESENIRLRALLQAAPRMGDTLTVAEILQVDADPFNHRIILDKGRNQGVFIGQPIIDGNGIMGEVVEIQDDFSRAILITDPSHAIPVENVRNGVRGIVVGTGAINNLELEYVPNAIDFKVGDTLVTSGLGGRFPAGYPIGTIAHVQQDPSESFAYIRVTPSAHLERGRQVLLVSSKEIR